MSGGFGRAAADRDEIRAVQNRYADACDARDWALFERVFTPDATADYGAFQPAGREAIVAAIRSRLGGCGATQHLLGNQEVAVEGDTASARCRVRAFHVGRGERREQSYEVFAEYRDRLVRTPEGWRIAHRTMRVALERGTREVLGPE